MWLLLYADNSNLISIVCPSSLRKGFVTVGGVDNLDHNPSSTTAQSSFLGTAISIAQFPTPDSVGDSRLDIPFITGDLDTNISLPQSYFTVLKDISGTKGCIFFCQS